MRSGLRRLAAFWWRHWRCAPALPRLTPPDCPGNSRAIGTSRTIVVDPREHDRIGTMDYAETLPLADHEVVLTFDDGPLPPYTGKILDILASECVQATYFIVGAMAREYPELVRRVYDEGHSVGTHSLSHPIRFRAVSLVERARRRSTAASPRRWRRSATPTGSRRSSGFPASDTRVRDEAFGLARGDGLGRRRPGRRLAQVGPQRSPSGRSAAGSKGKGILLLHDIHERTVDALPILLEELKARGFRIVHVVEANANGPRR